MRHLVRHGGIPTLNFGPARMEHGHGPNEHVRVDDYLAAIRILASIILEWCRGDGAAPFPA
jgi:acetylornithine deacetylase/succinyl-diaminopimelate desuccinylase-like protein